MRLCATVGRKAVGRKAKCDFVQQYATLYPDVKIPPNVGRKAKCDFVVGRKAKCDFVQQYATLYPDVKIPPKRKYC